MFDTALLNLYIDLCFKTLGQSSFIENSSAKMLPVIIPNLCSVMLGKVELFPYELIQVCNLYHQISIS